MACQALNLLANLEDWISGEAEGAGDMICMI